MILKFTLVSDEVADFKREIQIDGDATFFDLYKIIMECAGYNEVELIAFFLCNEYWERKEEITLMEKETDSDIDNYLMEEEILSNWFDEEKQKLIFMYDYYADRGFYMELSEMILGENVSKPICTNKIGAPPAQFIEEETEEEDDSEEVVVSPLLLDDEDDLDDDEEEEDNDLDDTDFYGDEDFSDDELDMDRFEDINGTNTDLDMPDEREMF